MSSPNVQSVNNPWFGVSMALIGFIVGAGVAFIAVGGGVQLAPGTPSVAAQPTPAPTPSLPTPEPSDVPPVTADDHVRGNPNATVSIIEYSDFECPFCQRVHPTISQVVDEYGDDVNWVYRHYPLSFHPNAQVTAEASECIAELGGNDAFWEFADIVFTEGAVEANLLGYAEEVGVDGAAFQTCLDSGKYADKIATQMSEGSAAGVTGTPGNIILNNETGDAVTVAGAQPFQAFQSAIDTLLGS